MELTFCNELINTKLYLFYYFWFFHTKPNNKLFNGMLLIRFWGAKWGIRYTFPISYFILRDPDRYAYYKTYFIVVKYLNMYIRIIILTQTTYKCNNYFSNNDHLLYSRYNSFESILTPNTKHKTLLF